jgi:hypothetical protein
MSRLTVLIAIAALLACTASAQRQDDPLRGLWSKIETGSPSVAEVTGIPYVANDTRVVSFVRGKRCPWKITRRCGGEV